ncbi:ATP-binding protein [Streptomyces sp. CC228A]|uniref:ATP-binding protein n=1 Tax=Streptomyces sp. CC228A TaxID=2898186 RepID=UPI001F34618A|nr:ATP-binding protein [Streptomyces sp. CC228A]
MPVIRAQEAVTVSVFAQRFSSTRRGAQLARMLAAHQLHVWGVPYDSPHSDAVLLVVAELAANVVLHGCVPGRDFELRLLRDQGAGRVRVEVSDTHDGRPVLAPAPVDGEHGRGLLLVDAVASRWGVARRRGPGKTVWVEVDCPGTAVSAGP